MKASQLILVRALTDSDMGLFATHRKATASRQRAIALTTPAVTRLIHPEIVRANGGDFDCICIYRSAVNREVRRVNKGSKNWRLGGRQLADSDFGRLDSKDFALIRSIPHNEGSSPMLITFVGRKYEPLLHAGLSATFGYGVLQHNVAILDESQKSFHILADLFPPIPPHIAIQHPGENPALI